MTGATPETPAQRLARVQGATAPVAAQVFGSGADLVNAGRQGLASGAALAPAPTVPSHQPIPVTIPGVGNITPALQSFDEKGRGLLQGFTQTVGALTPHDILPAPPQRLGMVRGPEGMAPAGYQPPATIGTAVPKTYAGPLAPTPSIANAITSGPSSPTAKFVGRQIPALAAFEAAGPLGEAAGKLLPVADEALPFLQQAVPRVAGLTAQGGIAGAISDPENPLRGFRQGATAAATLGGAGEIAAPALGAVGRGAAALVDRAPAAIQSGVDALGRLVPPSLSNEQGALFGATTPGRLLIGGTGGAALGAGVGAAMAPPTERQKDALLGAAIGGLGGTAGVAVRELLGEAERRGVAEQAARTDPRTGFGNNLAFTEARPRLDADPQTEVLSLDLRHVKAVNDTPGLGPDVADGYIQRAAAAVRQAASEAGLKPDRAVFSPTHASPYPIYSPKGDEFYVAAPKGVAERIGARAKELLGEQPLGEVTTGLRYGVGPTTSSADAAMSAAKQAEKGEAPPSFSPPLQPQTPPVQPPEAPPSPEAGIGRTPIVAGLAGTGLGAAAGYTQGTTPEARRRNAILGGLGGALAGGYGGHLLERPGEASIPPEEPSTPVTGNPAPLAAPGTLPAPVEGVQGPLRRPEQTALAQLGNAAPDVVAAQANLGRQIPGPRPQTLERFGKEAAEVAETTDPRVLAQLDPQRMTRAERGALSIHSAGRTEQALALDRQLNDPALPPEQRAALEAQRAQAVAEALQFHRAASTAATEAARDLVSRKAVFDQAHSVGVWQDVAEQTAGRPLTDGEAARLRQFYGAKDARGALGYIAILRPSSVGDKALTTWKAGLLTGGAIPVKATSDLTWGVMRDLSRVPGGMADYLLGLATRERTTAAQVNFGARVRGAAANAGDFGAALKGLPTTEELAAGHVPLQTNFGSPILTAALNGPFRILKGISEVAAKGAMQASIENQATALTVGLKGAERAAARARLILQPTAEMQVRAVQDALYDTMTDKTALGSALKGIQSIPGAGQVIMPFTRTPGSIATKVIAETGPVALVRGGYEAAQTVRQAFRDIATTGKASEATVARQALASKLLGQGVVGTIPILAGYLLYQNGRASGLAANMSPGQRQLRRSAAIPNDAFLIDGHWVAPDRLGIPGMLMSLGASLGQSQEMAQNKGLGAAAAFAGSAGRVVSDQPFVLGINRVLSTLQNPVGMGQRYIQDLATSTIPAVVRNAARSADSVERAPSTLGQAMASDLPGLRSGVPMQRDALGHGIPIVPQGLQQFGSPVKVSPNTLPTDPVMRELVRLGVTASAPKRQPDESDADYTARQIATGQRVEAAITSLLNQPAYWAAEGGAQAAMLRRAISRVQSTDSRAVRPVETPQQRLDRVTGRLPSPTLPMYTESP